MYVDTSGTIYPYAFQTSSGAFYALNAEGNSVDVVPIISNTVAPVDPNAPVYFDHWNYRLGVRVRGYVPSYAKWLESNGYPVGYQPSEGEQDPRDLYLQDSMLLLLTPAQRSALDQTQSGSTFGGWFNLFAGGIHEIFLSSDDTTGKIIGTGLLAGVSMGIGSAIGAAGAAGAEGTGAVAGTTEATTAELGTGGTDVISENTGLIETETSAIPPANAPSLVQTISDTSLSDLLPQGVSDLLPSVAQTTTVGEAVESGLKGVAQKIYQGTGPGGPQPPFNANTQRTNNPGILESLALPFSPVYLFVGLFVLLGGVFLLHARR